MTNSAFFFVAALIIYSSAVASTASGGSSVDFTPAVMKQQAACTGSIAECMAIGEFEMDTESNRRILATTKYISYGSLQRNSVPCSQRGASYYNCQAGGEANPYQRGCSAITRCRS